MAAEYGSGAVYHGGVLAPGDMQRDLAQPSTCDIIPLRVRRHDRTVQPIGPGLEVALADL